MQKEGLLDQRLALQTKVSEMQDRIDELEIDASDSQSEARNNLKEMTNLKRSLREKEEELIAKSIDIKRLEQELRRRLNSQNSCNDEELKRTTDDDDDDDTDNHHPSFPVSSKAPKLKFFMSNSSNNTVTVQ